MDSLSVELKPVNLNSCFSSTSPGIHQQNIDEVLLISSQYLNWNSKNHVLFDQIQSTLQLDPTHHPQHLLHLSLAQAIPLSVILLELIDLIPGSFLIKSPEFQAELKSQHSLLPLIIQQSELLQVHLPSFQLVSSRGLGCFSRHCAQT
ncbi:uncharacterized protein PGTG_19668 [Puccinia graminis f. sp. tritici CRL 75-36-700-3]|uniref:Uncharacterized protein n=1 Tax=Puccinia graminis f. sp. tritici (strain CRL 75-36-700-3 / race SCCL) TaxID=418459 RepID=E3LAX4_PUCGT|nr:uncharacterized protein PGTG_19668 [Puccinia graminis f. sp. tritici CRL 75-36-700-3]EFP93699.1 hypothetical protein PGTG_19668 [Puccinia graminis f. sp. tritici CRL 75-36-700-3]